jgi:DNA-directed RNA polymerase subunit RPC12/RpoP
MSDEPIRCPYCNSSQTHTSVKHKSAFFGNTLEIQCLKCGMKWEPGETEEMREFIQEKRATCIKIGCSKPSLFVCETHGGFCKDHMSYGFLGLKTHENCEVCGSKLKKVQ